MTNQVLFITSYPPRQCGIATYSEDLMNAIKKQFSDSFSLRICALDEGKQIIEYPNELKYIIDTSNDINYIEMAAKINADDDISCILIQHEFGLFGGEYGENLLILMSLLEKPIITTFHTVLPQPNDKRKSVVKSIFALSENVIVLTKTSADILKKEYAINEHKISVIYHGTHITASKDKNILKAKYGFKDRLVLSTFGLISSNKNIETALDSLPEIKAKFPNVLYLILGKTHPGVVKHEGEKYREFLHDKVDKLGLKDNVLFVNKYLSLDELLEYLALTDVYLFTSNDPHQAVSGTFAYAMASGCPIIATPIPHAKEMLDDGTGLLFGFEDSNQLAKATIKLLGDKKLRHEMGRNAIHKVRKTSWENVAIQHAKLFIPFINRKGELSYNLPEIKLDHLSNMTTRAGMIQFSDLGHPDKSSGYTLDDNARALVAVSNYYLCTKDISQIDKIDIYLNFIKYSQQEDGRFLNYVDYDGQFNPRNTEDNLEDSNGRAVWALGSFLSDSTISHDYFSIRAENILIKTFKWIPELKSPRAISFAIKGLYAYNIIHNNQNIKNIINDLAKRLMDNYYDNFDRNWEWFEPYLTYANSALPEAMLYAYLSSGKEAYKIIAHDSFDFLISKIFTENQINVISNNGWHLQDNVVNRYGEQPIDIAYTILTLKEFYNVFQEEKYRDLMKTAFSWFLGNNHLQHIIYNPSTGGCYDGLEEHNVNLNQGAESTICYLLARLAMEDISSKKELLIADDAQYETILDI